MPRFPPDKETQAAAAIRAELYRLDIGANDLGITQGACGGDLLFAEALLEHGTRLHLMMPFAQQRFLRESVAYSKDESQTPDRWRERYITVVNHSAVTVAVLPSTFNVKSDTQAYVACNQWMLDTALQQGADALHFICLWNGQGGDAAGGTQHMRDLVLQRAGHVHWIDTRTLW